MIVKVKTKPSGQYVITLPQAKDQLNIETAFTGKDTMLTAIVGVATDYIENHTCRYLIEQTLECLCESWLEVVGDLPFGYFQSVSSIVYVDVDGTSQTVSASDYYVSGAGTDNGRIEFKDGFTYPDLYEYGKNPITITIVIGYPKTAGGDYQANIPEPIKFAGRLYVEHLYDSADVERAVFALLAPYRSWRHP